MDRHAWWIALLVPVALSSCQAEPPAATRTEPAEAQVRRAVGPRWQAGRRYVYELALTSSVTVAGADMMGFSLRGAYAVEPRSSANGQEFAATLVEPKFEVANPQQRAQFQALAGELTEPHAFRLTAGKLTEVRMPTDWSRFASSISRTVAAALQFVEPPADSGAVWTANEADPTGSYEAEYKTVSEDVTAKRKLRYAPLSLGKLSPLNFAGKLGPEVLESNGSWTFARAPDGAGRHLARVDYQEQLKTVLAPPSAVNSKTTLVLVLKRADAGAELDWKAVVAGTKSVRPEEVIAATPPASHFDSERIGNYTFTSALRELESQARDPRQKELFGSAREPTPDPAEIERRESTLRDHGRVFSAMAALLRRDPKNVAAASARVREGSKVSRALLDALGSAGTPEAQAALVAVMNDAKLGNSQRRDATFSLMRIENATTATVSALHERLADSDSLRLYALYGLGSISRRLRTAGETARADAIVITLVKTLEAAKSPNAQVNALRAIANSGSGAALDAVRPFFGASMTKVRAAAVDAVRLMSHPDVDGVIAERLKSDEDEVKLAALDAIAVREPSATLKTALAGAAVSAARSGTRLKAVRLLSQWMTHHPDLRPALTKVAESDANEHVQEAARAALERQGVQFSKKK